MKKIKRNRKLHFFIRPTPAFSRTFSRAFTRSRVVDALQMASPQVQSMYPVNVYTVSARDFARCVGQGRCTAELFVLCSPTSPPSPSRLTSATASSLEKPDIPSNYLLHCCRREVRCLGCGVRLGRGVPVDIMTIMTESDPNSRSRKCAQRETSILQHDMSACGVA